LKIRKFLCRGAIVCLTVCASTVILTAQSRRKIDFSKLVVVGDSLAAGVENDSLADFQQIHGFAKVIARHVHTRLTLPLVPYPGAPNTLELVSAQFPPVIKQVPGKLIFPRLNPFDKVTDLAVPLQTVADALNRKPDNTLNSTDETQLATDIVLGYPCPILFPCQARSQVEQAVALHPTAIIVDIGNNDILGAITSGQPGSSLSSPQALQAFLTSFGTSYATLLNTLATTHATLIVANLPDVTETPFFIPVSTLAQEADIPLEEVDMALGTGPTDFLTLNALPVVEAILTNAQTGPLPAACSSSGAPCVVTAAEAAVVRQVTIQMNAIIQAQTAVHGALLVDVFSLFDRLHANGYTIRGTTLTTDFLGGLFSLDGIHPTNTGYAILANEFIKDINAAFDTHFNKANIAAIARFDPLVLQDPSCRRWWRRR
jgi:lysophospholipase L1-like esterase